MGLDLDFESESVHSRGHVASVAWCVFGEMFVPWGSCFCGVERLGFATIFSLELMPIDRLLEHYF